MAAPLPSTVTLPHGLPPWLVAFVEGALRENQTLTENGAAQAATAREVLLQKLVAAAQGHLDDELTVEEAAALLGRHPETIRRAVRKGALPDGRANAAGPPPHPPRRPRCRLLAPRPRDMIPLPMPRTSPDDGGLYDEDPKPLVEVHR